MKLFTIPFAGSSANYYTSWEQFFDKNIELFPLELAGRGNRLPESLNRDIYEMVDDLFKRVEQCIQEDDYMIFGHSLGALLAYELVHKIEEEGIPLPVHIFFSGRYSPNTQKSDNKILHSLPYDEFKNEIVEMGGTTSEIFNHPELTEVFLPILRNDIRIAETYCFDKENHSLLNCDFSILTGDEKKYAHEQLNGWRNLTNKKCEFYQFEGGHFFINSDRDKVVDLINAKYKEIYFEF